MAERGEWLIGALFKPTAVGWVYRAPNAWVFGPPVHYVVSDAQRVQITEAVKLRQPVLTVVGLAALLCAWTALVSAGMWWLGGRLDQPTGVDVVIMIVLILAPAFVAMALNARAMRKRLAPILATARVTQERITYREMRELAARECPRRSPRYLIAMGLLWLLLGIVQSAQLMARQSRHALFSDALSWLMVIFILAAIWLAVMHLWYAWRASREGERMGKS